MNSLHSRILLIIWNVTLLYNFSHGQKSDEKIFEFIDHSQSSIIFSNDVDHNLSSKSNLFDFDYFYNGAGVGVGDFNQDGLMDIVFAGNQNENELYINKGDFKFEQIKGALFSTKKKWSNGVTIVDINGDGLDDIYISQGGPHEYYDRSNLLYINQGNLSFIESAEEYGLNDQGISTQSAFFDYDKDGDLDCIVMNENSFYGLDPISFYQAIGENEVTFWQNSSHFYVNLDGEYIEATKEVGLLKPSFGLGLSVSDLNEDGWLDIYVANDYYVPDAMYINQKNGIFSDEVKERTDQLSFYGMGVDVADVNNDGHQDIFVLDMASSDHYRSKTLMRSMNVGNFRMLVNTLKFPHQYMFNSLQLGSDKGDFYNSAQYSGVAKTDWSWSVLMSDYDLDGLKDIFVTNGYRRYALDNDFQNQVTQTQIAYQGSPPLSEKERLYNEMPTEKLSNIIYSNKGESIFSNVTKSWGVDRPSFSNGAALADFDKDGDLDIVVNNIDDRPFLMRNNSVELGKGNFLAISPESPSFVKVIMENRGQKQIIEIKGVRGYMSHSEQVASFGLGAEEKVDRLTIIWPDGTTVKRENVKANQILKITKSDTKESNNFGNETVTRKAYQKMDPADLGISFKHVENDYDDFQKEILLPYQQSTLGPNFAVGDLNNDGLDDLLFLGASGQANELYLQSSNGWEKKDWPIFNTDEIYEDLDAIFFDLDQDGWKDIYFVTGGNKDPEGSSFYSDRVYLNISGNGFIRYNSDLLDSLKFSGKSGVVIDFDKDGDDDLIIGNRIIPQMFPYAAPSLILENRKGELVEVTEKIAPEFRDFGIVNDIEVFDFNLDGYDDFVVLGEWSEIGMFQYSNGAFQNVTGEHELADQKGWWYSIIAGDINGDGIKDLLFGNIGLNSKYQASKQKPLRVYGGDMDDNGTWDMVLSKKYKDKYVPFRGKECSTQQMPFISEKFPTYDLFASASIEDVYGPKLDDSYEEYANSFQSIMLISDKTGYQIRNLPNLAQHAPILDGCFENGKMIVAGNIYNTEVETPRMDMGRGLQLSIKDGEFETQSSFQTGLNLNGNVKSLKRVCHQKLGCFIIAGVNDGELKIFKEAK